VNASWVRFPLLLVLAALALADAARDRHAWNSIPGPAAASDLVGFGVGIEAVSVPDQPAPLAASRISHVSIGPRLLGGGPLGGMLRPVASPEETAAVAWRIAVDLRLHRSALARLGFAYRGAMDRAGAHSSFGTSLPPPLLA
jgi:hypothetical protein